MKKKTKIDVTLEEFVSRGVAAQIAVDAEIEAAKQSQLDAIETADAIRMIQQLAESNTGPQALAIAKRWLKKHWSDGWKAAGGPSGAPEVQ